ncbi:hypothetical protein LshimejAT787_0506070 [Lyophyllum shimeji]|uniref:Uncharacterized protein n=1 Tax=Lyophyllum shimeji TaxID=47721 RepID=A0A9P3UMW6_LYOSH|nr:hypothetical protein LshimejAT787_0506070 [Lyophyllum shimeji]
MTNISSSGVSSFATLPASIQLAPSAPHPENIRKTHATAVNVHMPHAPETRHRTPSSPPRGMGGPGSGGPPRQRVTVTLSQHELTNPRDTQRNALVSASKNIQPPPAPTTHHHFPLPYAAP